MTFILNFYRSGGVYYCTVVFTPLSSQLTLLCLYCMYVRQSPKSCRFSLSYLATCDPFFTSIPSFRYPSGLTSNHPSIYCTCKPRTTNYSSIYLPNKTFPNPVQYPYSSPNKTFPKPPAPAPPKETKNHGTEYSIPPKIEQSPHAHQESQ